MQIQRIEDSQFRQLIVTDFHLYGSTFAIELLFCLLHEYTVCFVLQSQLDSHGLDNSGSHPTAEIIYGNGNIQNMANPLLFQKIRVRSNPPWYT